MDEKRLDGTLTLESSVMRYAIGAELIALAAALGLFLVGGKPTRVALLVVSSVALLIFGLTALFVRIRYRRHPLVQEKQPLLSEYQQVEDEIRRNEAQKDASIKGHQTIDQEKEQELEQRRRANRARLADFQKRRAVIDQNQQRELGEALLRLQRQYIAEGLRANQIKDAKIRGVGPKLKQRLAAHRILTAADVEAGRIVQVDGFGESKAQAMLVWRAGVESKLKDTRPSKLPREAAAQIQRRYEQQRAEVAGNEGAERTAIGRDLAEIARRAESRHEEAHRLEARASSRLNELDPQRTALVARLESYENVTPRCFLLECVGIHGGRARGWQWVGVVLLPVVLGVSLLCQTGSTFGTLISMVIDSIPTRTPTPTATMTLTPTFTATPTPTPTVTWTPSPTLTPTSTPTRLPTETPTETPAPTPTATYTASPVPTVTSTPKPTPVRLEAQVVGVVDGRSLDAVIGGQQQRLCYIGIIVPAVGEYLGARAKTENQTLTEGKVVYVEKDEIEAGADGCLLAYVFLQNGTFVNEEMVRRGYATVRENPGNKRYYQRLVKAQSKAKTAKAGLWSPTPTPTLAWAAAPPRSCCKICTTGKACGDSCINRNYTCHKPPGCACNGW